MAMASALLALEWLMKRRAIGFKRPGQEGQPELWPPKADASTNGSSNPPTNLAESAMGH
jgi:hypothetical protein